MLPTLPEITIENVTLGYPGHAHVIEALTYTVAGPGMIRVEGPNGCGKSTLLEAIAGHLPVLGGSIKICGREAMQGRHSAVTFIRTEPALARSVTMRDHCLLFAGATSSGVDRISQLTSALSIQEYLDHVPAQLSSGTRRKFWLALGLLRKTPVLLLDEPFNELDENSSMWLKDQLIVESTTRLVVLVCHAWPAWYPLGTKERLTEYLTVARIPLEEYSK